MMVLSYNIWNDRPKPSFACDIDLNHRVFIIIKIVRGWSMEISSLTVGIVFHSKLNGVELLKELWNGGKIQTS